jgi:hypothetical protein
MAPATHLPGIQSGDFARSWRIQPLSTTPATWARVRHLTGRAGNAAVVLEPVSGAPSLTMPLVELAACYPRTHLALAPLDVGIPFRIAAALALREVEVPIRVVLDEMGMRRPPALFELMGQVPGGSRPARRVVVDRSPSEWAVHLEKHMMGEVLHAWHGALERADGPIRRATVKEASRFATRNNGGPQVGGLRPEHWPLLECYAAITLTCWEHLCTGPALHLAKSVHLSAAPRAMLESILDELVDLRPGEESVTSAWGDLTTVARGRGGLKLPLPWRTTYLRPAAEVLPRLERLARLATRLPDIAAALHRGAAPPESP